MGDIVPRKEVNKEGERAVGGLVGGGVLMVLAGGGVLGIVGGAILAAIGAGVAISKRDRLVGGILAGAGALGLLRGVLGLGGGWLLLGGAGLIGYGAYSAYQFFRKLKTRT